MAAATIWFTGLPSAGKTTLATAVAEQLRTAGQPVELLDGDEVREFLSKGLGFSREDRETNVTRIGYVAALLASHGTTVLASVISPYAASREKVRALHGERGAEFVEVYVATPVEVCSERDVKGLYAKQRAGELHGLTGVDDPYEAPVDPEVTVATQDQTLDESIAQIMLVLAARGFGMTALIESTPKAAPDPAAYHLSHLDVLESESIHVMREVAAEFEKPVLLFSGGKDSIVMLRLAEKAFWPAKIPFTLMHVDTGHNFDEVIDYRDRRVAELRARLVVASVQESIDTGRVKEQTGPRASRNQLQTVTLLDGIEANGFDAVFGGGRRDEEKARAKERFFSFRDAFGQWDPKNQRPELWNLYNARHNRGEHIRVFPISNWTELDVWQYLAQEQIEIPSIYYAHDREVFERDGMLLAVSPYVTVMDGEQPFTATVRYRTVGDASCTGAVKSSAVTIEEVIAEVAASRITERGATRADDKVSEAAMEDRKREGYF